MHLNQRPCDRNDSKVIYLNIIIETYSVLILPFQRQRKKCSTELFQTYNVTLVLHTKRIFGGKHLRYPKNFASHTS